MGLMHMKWIFWIWAGMTTPNSFSSEGRAAGYTCSWIHILMLGSPHVYWGTWLQMISPCTVLNLL